MAGFDLALNPGHDILDLGQVEQAVANVKPDAIIHLAAVSNVHDSREQPYRTWNVNLMGTVSVLEAARRAGTRSVVVASSNHVYGDHGGTIVHENADLRHLDTYSATKIALDYAARSYAAIYNLPVTIIRNTNCYGPEDPHHTHLIPMCIRSVLAGNPPVLRTPGHIRKAYLYVDDVADAYVRAAERQYSRDQGGEVFNISDRSYSAYEVATIVCRVLGTDLRPVKGTEPTVEYDEYLDAARARMLLNWRPNVSLEEGIRRTAEQFKKEMAAV